MATRKNCKKRRNRKKTVRGGKHLRDMDLQYILELFKSLPTRTKNALMRTLKRKHTHNSNESNDIELTSMNDKKKSYKPVSVNSEEPYDWKVYPDEELFDVDLSD